MKEAWKNLSTGLKILIIGLALLVTLLGIAVIVTSIQNAKLEKDAVDLVELQKKELDDSKKGFEDIIKGKEKEINDTNDDITSIRELRKKDQEDARYWYAKAQQRKTQIDDINKQIAGMDSSELRDVYIGILTAHNLN